MPGHPQPPVDPDPACTSCGACGAPRPDSPTRDADTTAAEVGSDAPRAWAPLPPLSPGYASGGGTDDPATGGYGGGYPGGGTGPGYTLSPSYDPEPARRRQWPVIAALVVALLAVGGGVWWVKAHDRPGTTSTSVPSTPPTSPASAAPTASSSAPTDSPTPTRATPDRTTSAPRPTVTVVAPPPAVTVTPSPSTDPNAPTAAQNAAAEEQLAAQRAADAGRFDRTPHVIAQLSSKHDGTVDPKQPTARGTTRWTSVDILAQYQQLRDRYGDVLLLRGTDLGSTNSYRNDWVTIYDPGTFTSVAQAQRWCDTNLPGGKNACYPSTTKG